ncbi:bifunctional 2',3'-cyclic-nucleotide 2'-phosphodiesterase/3'-nucleotidase [Roseovarius pacificus]
MSRSAADGSLQVMMGEHSPVEDTRPHVSTAGRPETGSVQIDLRLLETTDIHGNLLPFNYYTNQSDQPHGLARVATLIARARREARNCLLFDNGDFLQGTPMSDLTAIPANGWKGDNPVITAMNQLGYDAVGLGNHEFNFGLETLRRTLAQARFPVTCANVTDRASGKPAFARFQMLERRLEDRAGNAHDLRIAVIGLVPPQITIWDRTHLCDRLDSQGITDTARRIVPIARAAGADLIVALAHTGIETGPDRPDQENAALSLATVPGIDAILAGHSHRVFPAPHGAPIPGSDAQAGTLYGTPAVMAGFGGSHLGVLDLTLARGPEGWHVAGHRAEARPVAPGTAGPRVPPDPALCSVLDDAHHHTLKLVAQPLNSTKAPLHSYLAMTRTDPMLQLINRAKARALEQAVRGTADEGLPVLSATAPFKTGGRAGPQYYTDVPAGPLRLRHAADLYSFPNTLVGARIDGARLRDWLERAASCFRLIVPDRADQMLCNSLMPGHAFDVIDGVRYRIDLTQPPRYAPDGSIANPGASRIVDLEHDGAPVTDSDRFLIATNSYRAFGGGSYPALPEPDIVLKGSVPVRDILAAFIRKGAPVTGRVTPTWSFAPVPGASALHLTGPGLRAYPQAIADLGATDLGDTETGFMRLRLPLGR